MRRPGIKVAHCQITRPFSNGYRWSQLLVVLSVFIVHLLISVPGIESILVGLTSIPNVRTQDMINVWSIPL